MDSTAYRFSVGSRIRLLIAGGCFPRFDRNLGTGRDPAHETAMAPSHRTVDLSSSKLIVPVSDLG